jgi:hypothetical protein
MIGESDGITGSHLGRHFLERFYRETRSIAIPQYPGIHDYLTIHRRRRRATHAKR